MTTNEAEAKCPKCGYDLRGLPAAHVCPECGDAYDIFRRIVRLDYGRGWRGFSIVAVILLGIYASAIWEHWDVTSVTGLMPILLPLAFVPIFYLVRVLFWNPYRLVIDHDGVHVKYRFGDALRLPWDQLGQCRLDERILQLVDARGNTALGIQITALEGAHGAELVRGEIERLRRIYSGT